MSLTPRLLAHLEARQQFRGPEWLAALELRKREEAEFHNFGREAEDTAVIHEQQLAGVHANKKFYSVTGSSTAYVENWLRTHVPGRVFLDYACGNGRHAIAAARWGAALALGLDISDVSVRNARRAAAAAAVQERCSFIQGDCEATELPDESVDVILCSGMLHHLDLGRAYPELRRILRPGGRILAVEALGHNPLIQLYRNATPHLRTDWERQHILRVSDIQLARRWFTLGEIRFWHLFSLLSVPFRRTPLFGPLLRVLDRVDHVVLPWPVVGRMAWQVTFELQVPGAE
jgi:SAM-dependent methyltransferase